MLDGKGAAKYNVQATKEIKKKKKNLRLKVNLQIEKNEESKQTHIQFV